MWIRLLNFSVLMMFYMRRIQRGWTALLCAIHYWRNNSAYMILKAGADTSVADNVRDFVFQKEF